MSPDEPYCGVVWYDGDVFKRAPEPSQDDPVSFYTFESVEKAQNYINENISAAWQLTI